MPPKRRGSGRKRQRSPTASPSPRPTRAARISNDDRVASPVLSADEPQGSPAATGEECVYAQDDGLHRLPNITDEKLSERQLRLDGISEDIAQYYFALKEAKEKLGIDSAVVKVLEKVKQEAVAQYKRIDAEKTPDEEPTEHEVPQDQPEVLTLEQRQMNLESELFLLRGNVFPMIKDLERAVLVLREEIEARQE
ncbi:hypothetical protein FCIRC_1218 [Fusarium circinatum]|uniref:Uncharacterized protein n=1 Tax=Fusarium circinatum TaxID=48490 RepID=A0A8H5UFX4_FUSCI|nr:hypothetical protein FCIRC_1218 [Fusarium circinatum]